MLWLWFIAGVTIFFLLEPRQQVTAAAFAVLNAAAGAGTCNGRIRNGNIPHRRSSSSNKAHRNDKNDFNNDDADDFHEVSNDDELSNFLFDFSSRKSQMLQRQARLNLNLRQAVCTSQVSVVLPDWVRRLSVDYPLVACGSSSDTIYLGHIETREILASTTATRSTTLRHASITDERVEHLVHQLYGNFDGGGTLAVALQGTLLCEASRSGGVHVWRLDLPNNDNKNKNSNNKNRNSNVGLWSQGYIPALESSLVTSLRLDQDYLWVTTDQGTVEAYSLDPEALPLTLRTQPDLLWKVGSSRCTVLSLNVHTELGVAVVTTDAGTVDLLSLDDDDDDDEEENGKSDASDQLLRKPLASFLPPLDGTERRATNTYPTCATIVALNNNPNDSSTTSAGATTSTTDESGLFLNRPQSYAVACGASDGSLFLQPLNMDSSGSILVGDEMIDLKRPFQGQRIRTILPKHFAAVKCLASPAPGLLVSGGLDGTLRMWSVSGSQQQQQQPHQPLYQFAGYKVWLGSLWTDGERIVTDGADNTIIMHDFSTGLVGNKNNNNNSRSNRHWDDRDEDNNGNKNDV